MRVWPAARVRSARWVAAGVAAAGAALAWLVVGNPWVGAAVAAVIGPVAGYLSLRRYIARRRLVSTPFPDSWRVVLDRCVKFYVDLDEPGRARFEDDVRIFVAEQQIYGPRGAPVEEKTKVLVGASAAILTHGLPDWEWPTLRDIVIYSTSFDRDYQVGGGNPILGMVHAQGPIVFSARDLRHGFCKPQDGLNVGLHELAHVMDFADGRADGLPGGLSWVGTAPWIQLMAERLREFEDGTDSGALRDYAGQNEAELFAVAVEVFFERPRSLRKRDPALYELLRGFFGQDPATRKDARKN
jgi:MtfA peptidase